MILVWFLSSSIWEFDPSSVFILLYIRVWSRIHHIFLFRVLFHSLGNSRKISFIYIYLFFSFFLLLYRSIYLSLRDGVFNIKYNSRLELRKYTGVYKLFFGDLSAVRERTLNKFNPFNYSKSDGHQHFLAPITSCMEIFRESFHHRFSDKSVEHMWNGQFQSVISQIKYSPVSQNDSELNKCEC